jgi:hypothetical protein
VTGVATQAKVPNSKFNKRRTIGGSKPVWITHTEDLKRINSERWIVSNRPKQEARLGRLHKWWDRKAADDVAIGVTEH